MMKMEVELGRVDFQQHIQPSKRHILPPAIALKDGLSDERKYLQCLKVWLE